MPDTPNTNQNGQVLLSAGDGQNTSYWGPNNAGWWTGGVIGSAKTVSTTPVVLQTVNVGGFNNYLVNYSLSQSNTNASTTAAVIVSLVDGVGGTLVSSQVGLFTVSSRNSWSGSAVISAPNYGTNPFTLSFEANTGSGTVYIGYAIVSVVGLN